MERLMNLEISKNFDCSQMGKNGAGTDNPAEASGLWVELGWSSANAGLSLVGRSRTGKKHRVKSLFISRIGFFNVGWGDLFFNGQKKSQHPKTSPA